MKVVQQKCWSWRAKPNRLSPWVTLEATPSMDLISCFQCWTAGLEKLRCQRSAEILVMDAITRILRAIIKDKNHQPNANGHQSVHRKRPCGVVPPATVASAPRAPVTSSNHPSAKEHLQERICVVIMGNRPFVAHKSPQSTQAHRQIGT